MALPLNASEPVAHAPVLLAGGSIEARTAIAHALNLNISGVGVSRPMLIVALDPALTSDLQKKYPGVPILTLLPPASRPLAGSTCGAQLLGESAAMVEARAAIARLGRSPCSVLVSGETGTGKEIAARLIHEASPRGCKPFVAINCAAIPEALLEAELFGYEKGAFTGAISASHGKLAAAEGGTVFLDEVGELPLSVQAKLLRAIEQREVQRLGALRPSRINVRWITATNRDLETLAREGRFRADLYYRLNVAHIELAPLRERREDIALLARHFLTTLSEEYAVNGVEFTPDVLEMLEAHSWPGNVRELRNVVESCLVHSGGEDISPEHLPAPFWRAFRNHTSPDEDERRRLLATLKAVNGNKTEAAGRMQWSRMTLYRKMARYGIAVTASDNPVTRPGGSVKAPQA